MRYRRIRDIPENELDRRRALCASNQLAESLFLKVFDGRLIEINRIKRRKEVRAKADRKYKASLRVDNALR
jgi:hypothetical protein